MPVLASDGGHKLNMTDRINTRFGSDYRGSHIPHFGSSPPAKGSGGLPPIVGPPLVKNNTHQEKLAEEYHYFPAQKSESASTDTKRISTRNIISTKRGATHGNQKRALQAPNRTTTKYLQQDRNQG